MIEIGSNIRWSSSRPDIRFYVYYERQRNGADMQYRIKTKIVALTTTTSGGTFGYPIIQDISFDGIGYQSGYYLKGTSPSSWSSDIEYTTDWFTIANKVSGTTALTLRLYSAQGSSRNEYYNFTLDIDPAYANITQSFSNKTETTITMNWNSDYTLSHIWYSTNNGSSWVDGGDVNSTNGTYTISGLSANTTYNIKTKGRRSGTTLDSTTGTNTQTTYPYPYANSMPSFVIGNAVNIGIYNPLGRNITVNVLDKNDTSVYNTSGVLTSVNTTINGDSLYSSIPNQQSANYKVKVSYSGNDDIKTGGTYTINTSVCSPSITSVSYEDKFADTLAITSDSSILVSGYSKVKFTATGLTTLKSATIKRVELRLKQITNTPYTTLTVSGTSASVENIVLDVPYYPADYDVYITLVDSRDLTYTKKITTDLRQYFKPTFTYEVKRQSNFYTATDIKVKGTYTNIGSNTLTLKCKYKKLEDSTWSNWTTLTNDTTSTINLDNAYVWDVYIQVNDALNTIYTTTRIGKGVAPLYVDILKNSVGISCFPKYENTIEIDSAPINSKYTNDEVVCGEWFGNLMYRSCDFGVLDDVNTYDSNFYIEVPIDDMAAVINWKITIAEFSGNRSYQSFTLPYIQSTIDDNYNITSPTCMWDGSNYCFSFYIPTTLIPSNEWTNYYYAVEVDYIKSIG